MGETVIDDVLDFWFGVADRQAWFQIDTQFDQEIAARFGDLILPACAGTYDQWLRSGAEALALCLVLDQFPRNVHRGTASAFACDAKAREVARFVLRRGLDREVAPDRRLFLYLPFEHAERLEDQDTSCRLMATLNDPRLSDHAERHREIIARFGRFPHRNAILGRSSTEAERAFLEEPGSSF